MKRPGLFLILFSIVSLVEVASILAHESFPVVLAKPLIMLSLLGYYATKSPHRSPAFIAALCASWVGDILLMFQSVHERYFLLGLTAFLIMQIFYIVSYRQSRTAFRHDELLGLQKMRFSFPVILAGTGLIILLNPYLGNLRLPVIVYATVLITMVLQASFRFKRTSSPSFWFVFAGAVFFMLSDAMLALNKFRSPLRMGDLMVMSSYIAGQFLIVTGILKHEIQGAHKRD